MHLEFWWSPVCEQNLACLVEHFSLRSGYRQRGSASSFWWSQCCDQLQAPKLGFKVGPNMRPFFGHKSGATNFTTDSAPSDCSTHFFDQNLGAFLGPPPWTCNREIGCSDHDALSSMATPDGLPTTIVIAATATAATTVTSGKSVHYHH